MYSFYVPWSFHGILARRDLPFFASSILLLKAKGFLTYLQSSSLHCMIAYERDLVNIICLCVLYCVLHFLNVQEICMATAILKEHKLCASVNV